MKTPNVFVGESIMRNTRKFLETSILALGGLLLPIAAASAQPHKTVFCIADGTQIGVDRFEMKNGKFLLYVQGSAEPLEYPTTSVKGIDVPCGTAPVVTTTATATAAPTPAPAPTAAHFGIAGSNTIGERLMPMLIDAYGSKRLGMEPQSKITGKEEQEITLRSSAGPQAVISFAAHGSGTATPGLVEGKAIIGMASRALNDAETKLIDERFKVPIRAAGNEHVLALDGIAVIVHPDNAVKQLSLEQIAKVFSAQIANWKDVGGADRPIHVLRRNNDSGTYDTFNTLVLAPLKLQMSPQAAQYESSETLSSDVSKDADAIGFIALPYINKNHALTIGSSCGIVGNPSAFTVKNEQYPLARRLYLYTVGTPNEPVARELLKFALSDEAQPTIEDAEFIDQRVAMQDEQEQRAWAVSVSATPDQGLGAGKLVPRDAVDDFTRFAYGARRSSVVFRFEKGSSQLDTRAQQDVGRLARFISSKSTGGKQFWIVGFTDADGGWGENLRLGKQRADQVARELGKVGVRVPPQSVRSQSYLAPTVCNDTDAAKGKNRRVEVWFEK
jgi:phosphate transport system substrate-binding protein